MLDNPLTGAIGLLAIAMEGVVDETAGEISPAFNFFKQFLQ
jgi:hypothetical protein